MLNNYLNSTASRQPESLQPHQRSPQSQQRREVFVSILSLESRVDRLQTETSAEAPIATEQDMRRLAGRLSKSRTKDPIRLHQERLREGDRVGHPLFQPEDESPMCMEAMSVHSSDHSPDLSFESSPNFEPSLNFSSIKLRMGQTGRYDYGSSPSDIMERRRRGRSPEKLEQLNQDFQSLNSRLESRSREREMRISDRLHPVFPPGFPTARPNDASHCCASHCCVIA